MNSGWRPERNLVLVGFMGSGKSSVGRELARRCRFRFLDTDIIVRQKLGQSIAEIFATAGEPAFREEERLALASLLGRRRIVLATGGGIVGRATNRALLKQLGHVVWITAAEEVIWQRVSRNTHRPLLQTDNPRATIQQLLLERIPIYRTVADVMVDSTTLSHAQTAEAILAAVHDLAHYAGGR